jgi:hypothetical protein
VLKPGKFTVEVITTHQHLEPWSGGHTARVESVGRSLRKKLTNDREVIYTQAAYFPRIATKMGKLEVKDVGSFRLRLRLDRIKPQPKDKPLWNDLSPMVVQVRLTPA